MGIHFPCHTLLFLAEDGEKQQAVFAARMGYLKVSYAVVARPRYTGAASRLEPVNQSGKEPPPIRARPPPRPIPSSTAPLDRRPRAPLKR